MRTGYTALILAASEGHVGLHCAHIILAASEGHVGLHCAHIMLAASEGHVEVVIKLAELGANPAAADAVSTCHSTGRQ